jgi:hypothetical protein
LALGVALSAENEERPGPHTSITIPELKDHMFFLASDELKGRLTASREYRIAANYCVSQLRAAGLKPLVPDEKGNLSLVWSKTSRKERIKIQVFDTLLKEE